MIDVQVVPTREQNLTDSVLIILYMLGLTGKLHPSHHISSEKSNFRTDWDRDKTPANSRMVTTKCFSLSTGT